jgi:hypothetical protein
MNLISEFTRACDRIREPFSRLVEDMDYKDGAICYSQGLAFCAM